VLTKVAAGFAEEASKDQKGALEKYGPLLAAGALFGGMGILTGYRNRRAVSAALTAETEHWRRVAAAARAADTTPDPALVKRYVDLAMSSLKLPRP
jgi:hypothetical protein